MTNRPTIEKIVRIRITAIVSARIYLIFTFGDPDGIGLAQFSLLGIVRVLRVNRYFCQCGKLLRGQVPQRAVRPFPIVMSSPGFHLLFRILQGQEPVLVQALLPESPVERLDEGVVRGLAGMAEVRFHPALVGSLVERFEVNSGALYTRMVLGSRRFPLVALLQLAVAATLCGARSLYAIAQWGRERLEDAPGLLESLGLPPGRSPSVATLHRVFKALDVAAFERAVGQWLAQTGVAPTDPAALDGKSLRGIHGDMSPGVHLVAAYAHDAQAVVAQAVVAQMKTESKGGELAAAREVLDQVPLKGRMVTADALMTQREVCRQIAAGGGDYLLPVKKDQPSLRADLAAAFSPVASPGARGAGPAGGPALGGPGVGRLGRASGWGNGGGTQEPAPAKAGVRHGRREARMVWALYDPGLNRYAGSAGVVGEAWPNLEQVCRVERRRTPWRRGQPAGKTPSGSDLLHH